jgi:hypothetical protein
VCGKHQLTLAKRKHGSLTVAFYSLLREDQALSA